MTGRHSPESDRVIAALVDVLGRNLTDEDVEIATWFTLGWTAKAMDREQGEPLAVARGRGRGPKPGDWAT